MDTSKLITFEGCEGAGKTTLAIDLGKRLLRHLNFEKPVLLTAEPCLNNFGLGVRDKLLSKSANSKRAELLLFAADRAEHCHNFIYPRLDEGAWVICDRFIDSSYANQGYGLGLPLRMVEAVNNIATGGLIPDLTIFLDINPRESLRRIDRPLDSIENSDIEFHERVYTGYKALCELYPKRIVAIDANRPFDTVADEIFKTTIDRLLP
ncbi:dTMP kinase [Nodosilinea nodulosa]|uniref:dTMP kinase n=1 Tax=Nodosilinea nodulosa TaxID=416001 RepID=UPI00037CD19B|nr:dTMP kinase [Nodosilinea nodulosa]